VNAIAASGFGAEPLLRVFGQSVMLALQPFFMRYSPECVEGVFCELRHNGVLRFLAKKIVINTAIE